MITLEVNGREYGFVRSETSGEGYWITIEEDSNETPNLVCPTVLAQELTTLAKARKIPEKHSFRRVPLVVEILPEKVKKTSTNIFGRETGRKSGSPSPRSSTIPSGAVSGKSLFAKKR